jgi:hypothetical protein
VFEIRLLACLAGNLPFESFCQPCFVVDVFERGSYELFARAGFELLISAS